MRTVAICTDPDVCIGLRLAGVESYCAASEEELTIVIEEIEATDVGIIVACESFTKSPSLENFYKKNPQILSADLP